MPESVPTNLAEMRSSVQRWLMREKISDDQINDAINDAIESFWDTAILAVLNIFMGGPVNVTIPSAAERVQLTTIPDPTVAPTITATAGGNYASTHDVYAVYTIVTDSGSETLPSPIGSLTNIAIANVALIAPPSFVSGALGWNLYTQVNATGSPAPTDVTMFGLQNADPQPFGASYQEPDTGFVNPNGQNALNPPPVENTTGDNIAFIQHLEFKVPTGQYIAFDAGDLDSTMMRRFNQVIATPSPYQQYAWDLINQRQLEIRPAAGATFIPRYFYIAKPRRLAFDNSPLPFQNAPTTKYFRCQSLSDLFLSIHEYTAAAAWETKAQTELLRAVRAVSRINTNRNVYVTPFR